MTGSIARAMILKQVAAELRRYQHGKKLGELPKRTCQCGCGTTYRPRHGYHFLATDDCRRRWRRGWFRPKKED